MTVATSAFSLLGAPEDETRLLVDRGSGYSIAVPGVPGVGSAAGQAPIAGIVVVTAAPPLELAFRIDSLPAEAMAGPLAAALALTFASARTAAPPTPLPLRGRMLAAGATTGVTCTYPLVEAAGRVEHLAVTVREHAAGWWVLYHCARFTPTDVNPVQWAHIRTAMAASQHWDPAAIRTAPPSLWPRTSELALPGAALRFTDSAWEEAQAKARDLGDLPGDDARRLLELLLEFSANDDPPTHEVHPYVLELATRQVAMCGPTHAAEVLLRNVAGVRTTHDLRAWCWQCIWAMGNRSRRVEPGNPSPP